MLEGVCDLWEQASRSFNFPTLDAITTSTVIRAPENFDKLAVELNASRIFDLTKLPHD